jgi:cytochrome d ubiquinol oxidase subunit I
MVVAGFLMLFIFAAAFYYSTKHQITQPRWLLKAAFWGLPLPWIACEAGWFVAEYGRQPWSIAEILPVHTSVSNLSEAQVLSTIVAYSAFYTVMFIAAFYLMQKFAKKGPTLVAQEQAEMKRQDELLAQLDSKEHNND